MNANYRQLSFIQLNNLKLLFKDDLSKTLKDLSGANRVGNDLAGKLTVSFHTPGSSKQSLIGNNFLKQGSGPSGKNRQINQHQPYQRK